MRALAGMAAFMVLGSLLADTKEGSKTFTFAKADLGKLPGGWKAEQTHEGEGSVWKVVADDTSPSKTGYVLAQTAAGPNRMFNLCVDEKTSYKDVTISVRIKPVKGKLDQGGGVVWCYQDHDNYYICRMNPLEDNFRVYKVVKGKRIQLGTKEDLRWPVGKWFTLSITQKGDQITCSLDGKQYLEAKDDTFKEAGKVGLWSKADAQSHFDNLTIEGR